MIGDLSRSRFSVLTSRVVFPPPRKLRRDLAKALRATAGRFTFAFAACSLAFAAPGLAQTPSLVNGRLAERTVTGTLGQTISGLVAGATGPVWIGYAVPVGSRGQQDGCWSTDGSSGRSRVGPLKLEGPDSLFVLLRVVERQVQRVRLASAECPLDINGLTLHWLTGVRSAESVDWLESLITADGPRRLSSSATLAIALHDDARAIDRLIALAKNGPSRNVRADALFWVAQRAGDKAAGAISDALQDPDSELRTKAVFALSQLPKNEGVPKMIELARSHKDPAVRRQAMFWLGQSRDPRALEFFERVLR